LYLLDSTDHPGRLPYMIKLNTTLVGLYPLFLW